MLYRGRRRAGRGRGRDRQDRAADRHQLAAAAARRSRRVIIGARNEEQLRQNLGAVGWSLTPEQIAAARHGQRSHAPYPHFPYHPQEGFAAPEPTGSERLRPPIDAGEIRRCLSRLLSPFALHKLPLNGGARPAIKGKNSRMSIKASIYHLTHYTYDRPIRR